MKQTMLLHQFAAQAKKYLGNVHLTRLFTDQAYAMDVVLHAYTTNDKDLIDSAKSLLNTLKLNEPLILQIERFLSDYTRTLVTQSATPSARASAIYLWNSH